MIEKQPDDTQIARLFGMIAVGHQIKIEKHDMHVLQIADKRDQKEDQMAVKGFAAIHYAIYFKNIRAFDYIVKQKEYLRRTAAEFPMPFNRYTESKKLTLDRGIDALTLAIACNNVYATQSLLQVYKKRQFGFANQSDNTLVTSFLIAVLVDNDCTHICFKDFDFVAEQIGLQDFDETNNLNQIFSLKRLELFKILVRDYVMQKDAPLRKHFFQCFIQINACGEGARHQLDEPIDFKKLGSCESDQRELIFLHDEFLEQIHDFCSKNKDKELQEQLDDYRTEVAQRRDQAQKKQQSPVSRNSSQAFRLSKLRISRSQSQLEEESSSEKSSVQVKFTQQVQVQE